MNTETHQAIYRQEIDENKYNQVTIAKKNGDTFIKVEAYENGSIAPGGSKLYSFINIEGAQKMVELNVEDRTYTICDESVLLPSIASYDFDVDLPNKVEENYVCGTGEDAFSMTINDDER